jgi:hypothetical protein
MPVDEVLETDTFRHEIRLPSQIRSRHKVWPRSAAGRGWLPKWIVDCRVTFPACPTTKALAAVSIEERRFVRNLIDGLLLHTDDRLAIRLVRVVEI